MRIPRAVKLCRSIVASSQRLNLVHLQPVGTGTFVVSTDGHRMLCIRSEEPSSRASTILLDKQGVKAVRSIAGMANEIQADRGGGKFPPWLAVVPRGWRTTARILPSAAGTLRSALDEEEVRQKALMEAEELGLKTALEEPIKNLCDLTVECTRYRYENNSWRSSAAYRSIVKKCEVAEEVIRKIKADSAKASSYVIIGRLESNETGVVFKLPNADVLIAIDTEGPPTTLKLNASYFADALRRAHSPARIGWNGNLDPLGIGDLEIDLADQLELIMPMRP